MYERICWTLAVAVGFVGSLISTAHAEEKVDFNRDIRPLLADKCIACHGHDAENAAADMRLDNRADATKVDSFGDAPIVPGKPELSKIIARINAEDIEERMPPVKSHKTLSAEEKELLARWVKEGAEYKDHWGFTTPQRPEAPSGDALPAGAVIRNPIDAFVAARLKNHSLKMSPEADRTTLIRRATLDLTGLPPTPAEVDAFVADKSDNAYEKVLDRLLASPRYGERMTMWWLDGARYADSNGFQSDDSRRMWQWRDWVIDAFNSNMPFDQFTVEQLAGDLLPNPTMSQRLATGFNRNHRINGEGGSIAEEWRVEGVIDRVETTSAVWMGLTLGCARCHDHKYDPLTQKEFYQFFSFFNNVPESGMLGDRQATAPVARVVTKSDEEKFASLDAEVAAIEQQIADAKNQLKNDSPEHLAEWEKTVGAALRQVAKIWSAPVLDIQSTGGAVFERQNDSSYLAGGSKPTLDTYTIRAQVGPGTISVIQLDVLPNAQNAAGGFGRAGNGNIVLSEVEVESITPDGKTTAVELDKAEASYSQQDWNIASTVDRNKKNGWALNGNDRSKHLPRHARFILKNPVDLPQGGTIVVRLDMVTLANHTLGQFRVLFGNDPTAPYLEQPIAPPAVIEALTISEPNRNESQKSALRDYLVSNQKADVPAELLAKLDTANKAKKDAEAALPTVMVMEEMKKPRDCFILIRGQYDQRGEKVTAGLPSMLPPLPEGEAMNRLGLARWLVSPTHPLTARVQVNRFWEILFGSGIVKSSDNFGMQAQFPNNPQLLDWLATEFIRNGWDTKAMLKTIMLSATYRQSSATTPEIAERDPDNQLLSHGPRFRIQAELVRDNALSISGLLVEKQGGPSVRPYQPNGVWDEMSVYGDLRNYKHDKDNGLYRRSMYTIWKRTAAPPNMTMFDMPNREICAVKRSRTNTPLQALALLNEVTYIEAARSLAQRMMLEGGATPKERIAYGFRLAISRDPTDAEMATLSGNIAARIEKFRANLESANALISQGESKPDPKLDPAELAGYTITASVILNLDETITKE